VQLEAGMTPNHVIERSSPPYRVLVPVRPSGGGQHRADRFPVEVPVAGARLVLSIGVFVAIPLLALNLRPAVTSVGATLADIRSGTGMSAVLASVVVAAPVWCFALGGALAWTMRTRLGTSRTVSLALAALAMTLAVRVLGGPYLLLGGTVVACLAIAVLGTLLPVITHAAPARAWALLTGCYVAAMGGGSGIGALVTPQVADRSSWQLGVSGWALLAAAAWAAWRVASRRFSEPAVRATKHPGPRSLAPAGTAWSLTLHFGLTSGFTFSIMGWLPSMLADYSHVDPPHVEWMFTVAMALGVPIALLVPKWARATACQSGLAVALAAPSLVATVGLLILPEWSPWLWSVGLGLGMPAVGLALAMISLRAAPDGDTAAALSSMVQGIGYAIAGATALFCGLLHSSTGTWDWPLLALLVILCGQIVSGMHAGVPVTIHAGGAPEKRSIPAPRPPTPLPSAARRELPPAAAPISAPPMHAPVLPPRPMRAPMPPPAHVHPPMQRPGHRTPAPVNGWGHHSGWPMSAPPPVRPPMRHPNGPWHGPAVPPLFGPPSRPPRPAGPPPIAAIADNAKTGALIPSPRVAEKRRRPAVAEVSTTEKVTPRTGVSHLDEQSSTEVVVPKRRVPAVAESSTTEKVTPRSGGPVSQLGEQSSTEVVVPQRGRPAVAEVSTSEKVTPRTGVSHLDEQSSTEVVVPQRGRPAVAEVSSTEKVTPRTGVSHLDEQSATEKVMPRTGGSPPESDAETAKAGSSRELPTPHFPPPAGAADVADPRPEPGEPSLPEPHFPAPDTAGAAAEAVIPAPRAGEPEVPGTAETDDARMAEAMIPEPRAGDTPAGEPEPLRVPGPPAAAEEASAIYAPERSAVAEPAASPRPRSEAAVEPEQLELALVLESESVTFEPRMFPDRTIHIPYPRQAST
jgi:CP family cyanate transporter-like MFS transporter